MRKQMVKVIATLVMISVLLVLVACGQSNNKSVNSSVNSPKNNNQSESLPEQSPEQPINDVENTNGTSGDIKWSNSIIKSAFAYFSVKVPEGWNYVEYGASSRFFKIDKEEKDIYSLLVGGYDDSYGKVPESLTLEQLPDFLGESITRASSGISRIYGELEQKIVEEQVVNVNGLEMLKASGDILTKEMAENMSFKYFGYYAFFTNLDNEFRKSEHVPIYLIMLVNSEDEEKIEHGKKILDAVVGTLEKYILGSK